MNDLSKILVPGAVWLRSKPGKKPTASTVIAISNVDLSEAILEKFPMQVIFLTDRGRLLTQDIETFTSSREFVEIDVGTANLVDVLLHGADYDDEETEARDILDIDQIPLPEDEDASAGAAQVTEVTAVSPSGDAPMFSPEIHQGLDLNGAFLSYTEQPYYTGDTMHVLRFALDGNVTIKALRKAFDVSAPEGGLATFTVDCYQEEPTVVTPSGFIDTFFEVTADGNGTGVVYLITPGNFRVPEYVEPEKQPVQPAPVAAPSATPMVHAAQPALHIIPQMPQSANITFAAPANPAPVVAQAPVVSA